MKNIKIYNLNELLKAPEGAQLFTNDYVIVGEKNGLKIMFNKYGMVECEELTEEEEKEIVNRILEIKEGWRMYMNILRPWVKKLKMRMAGYNSLLILKMDKIINVKELSLILNYLKEYDIKEIRILDGVLGITLHPFEGRIVINPRIANKIKEKMKEKEVNKSNLKKYLRDLLNELTEIVEL